MVISQQPGATTQAIFDCIKLGFPEANTRWLMKSICHAKNKIKRDSKSSARCRTWSRYVDSIGTPSEEASFREFNKARREYERRFEPCQKKIKAKPCQPQS